MSDIRRYSEANIAYFVTSVSKNRKPIFTKEKSSNLLLLSIEYFKIVLDYKIFAYCILPEHLHFIIQPFGKHDLSYIMKMLKGNFARRLNKINGITGDVWQRGFYDEGIRNDSMLFQKIEYIHYNPIKHKLITDLSQYEYSSYQHYFNSKKQILTIDDMNS